MGDFFKVDGLSVLGNGVEQVEIQARPVSPPEQTNIGLQIFFFLVLITAGRHESDLLEEVIVIFPEWPDGVKS